MLANARVCSEDQCHAEVQLACDAPKRGQRTLGQLAMSKVIIFLLLQQKLVEYQAYEAGLKLEIEKQYPNVTLSPGLLFEEGQALWVLAAAAKLPVFHNNDGQIQRALAERKQKQHEFIQLQSSLLTELARAQQNYQDRLGASKKIVYRKAWNWGN